ncbi:amidohydrolase family protein [Mycolicibacterium aubagnense]|uniref:Amidohydrolase n=1 Tax=Mycolicibacterium aubagnense TaxID=319707 RepID=A0ABN5YMK9_9MYCO|nr:amidohydrolase family protein [Mycolicibacterium aubagnense]TLH61073.1 amidohydrolase [Mycolicibacterium aubagnense]WGI35058.1 amidohydrolase family protein [Mycolicibacterium aubagnense]BBX83011.1 amidohydrolase [Mycolicibacterium aubagnense]
MLIQRAVLLDGRTVDIRVARRIEAIATGLEPIRGETVVDAAGGAVIPGLHDHHVHLRSAAAALASVRVGPGEVRSRDALRSVLGRAALGEDGWIRAVGYHEAVAGALDRAVLDQVSPDVPVRVQHRSGVLWTLNSAGLAAVGLPEHPDGRLRSADPSWSHSLHRRDAGLGEISRRLSSFGVTGVTDATPALTVEDVMDFAEARRRGELRQRVEVLAPAKRILHDDDLDLDALTDWIAVRHRQGGIVALHCVTAMQLVVAISALQQAGTRPGDRIEHGAVIPDDCLADLHALGVLVVTQPNFVAERGDQYFTDVPADEHCQLWRVASLCDAQIPVALSTDMPFGDTDPWAAMRAAVHRTTPTGRVLGAGERIDAATALGMFLGSPQQPNVPRQLTVGMSADLCVLSAPPRDVLATLDASLVAATVYDGAVVYEKR